MATVTSIYKVTSIHMIHGPLSDAMKTDWPVYKLWHLLKQLRREPIDVPGVLSMPVEDCETDQNLKRLLMTYSVSASV